ncbi:MAG TPA: hypothetical protein VG186_05290 [Solirubrobacteraceae bacterium]|jgi:hypothetical protein|nr:hypothetical protein [Solirubrobacteraceae bacterium]
MARNDPPHPGAADDPEGAGAGPEPSEEEETLRRLSERLDRASDTAERLIAEAAAESATRAADAFRRPPPAGWQAPETEEAPGRSGDLDLLVQLLESLRDLIPPELQQRLAEAVRELLLAVRALINWYLERLDKHAEEPAEVQDIPINWD